MAGFWEGCDSDQVGGYVGGVIVPSMAIKYLRLLSWVGNMVAMLLVLIVYISEILSLGGTRVRFGVGRITVSIKQDIFTIMWGWGVRIYP